MKVYKSTYEVDGINEPCIYVCSDDDFIKIRLACYYHYLGANTILITEYLDGEYNSSEELKGDFKNLSLKEAERIARGYSVYLN